MRNVNIINQTTLKRSVYHLFGYLVMDIIRLLMTISKLSWGLFLTFVLVWRIVV